MFSKTMKKNGTGLFNFTKLKRNAPAWLSKKVISISFAIFYKNELKF